jgi:phosphatidate cytidylyltransferase
MSLSGPALVFLGIFLALSALEALRRKNGDWHVFGGLKTLPVPAFLNLCLLYTATIFFSLFLVEAVSFSVGVWVLAPLCFWALREYFTLVDLRLQDRLAVLGAYLSIPFMIYYIQVDWYNMFIISIPVYAFLAIPLLVALGGKESQGAVFSIGAIDFGLFLFVYCMGHVGYLMLFSVWKAAMLVLATLACDVAIRGAAAWRGGSKLGFGGRWALCLPLSLLVCLSLAGPAEIPTYHSIELGLLIPLLALAGHYMIDYLEADLGVRKEALAPGRGLVLDSMKSLFFTAPVVFHYIKYFLT